MEQRGIGNDTVIIVNLIFNKEGGVYMDICPKCKAKLNMDEKTSGRCFSCGEVFESSLYKESKPYANYSNSYNSVARALRICGIIIIILGTIGSFVIANKEGYTYFLVFEIPSIISGLLLIGVAEIIQLLADIKAKLK